MLLGKTNKVLRFYCSYIGKKAYIAAKQKNLQEWRHDGYALLAP
jgi:hypothetical protein